MPKLAPTEFFFINQLYVVTFCGNNDGGSRDHPNMMTMRFILTNSRLQVLQLCIGRDCTEHSVQVFLHYCIIDFLYTNKITNTFWTTFHTIMWMEKINVWLWKVQFEWIFLKKYYQLVHTSDISSFESPWPVMKKKKIINCMKL